MKIIKNIIAILFVYMITLLLSVNFDIGKISINQGVFNLIYVIMFSLSIWIIIKIDKWLLNRNVKKLLLIVLRMLSIAFNILLILFINSYLKKTYYGQTELWPTYWLVIFPVSYLVYILLSLKDCDTSK